MLKLTCLIVFFLFVVSLGTVPNLPGFRTESVVFLVSTMFGACEFFPHCWEVGQDPRGTGIPGQSMPVTRKQIASIKTGIWSFSRFRGGSDVFARIFMAYWLLKSGYFKKHAINKLSLG